jgi:hypothetical protein
MTENCRTGAPWSMSVSASMMGKMRRPPWVSAFKTVFNAQSTGGRDGHLCGSLLALLGHVR